MEKCVLFTSNETVWSGVHHSGGNVLQNKVMATNLQQYLSLVSTPQKPPINSSRLIKPNSGIVDSI